MLLEKYRNYFDIDPDYFPAVNESVITKNPDMWKKFYPHETFVKLIKDTVKEKVTNVAIFNSLIKFILIKLKNF